MQSGGVSMAEGKPGAIVLCGGRSRRMGWPKTQLPFGRETLLERVTRQISALATPIVLVAARGKQDQYGGEGTSGCRVVHDLHPDRGPLEGLYAGLAALQQEAAIAYVSSCDAPFVVPAVVQRLTQLLADHEIVVASDGDRCYPMPGVYRTSLALRAHALLAEGKRRLQDLLERSDTRRVDRKDLQALDPGGRSFWNVNTPPDYEHALREAGLPLDSQMAARLRLGSARDGLSRGESRAVELNDPESPGFLPHS
ncbi:MAG: molybdenum cofactor guanylyltransferase [Pirellulaceae bacterium]